jgi:hypothetical protein
LPTKAQLTQLANRCNLPVCFNGAARFGFSLTSG